MSSKILRSVFILSTQQSARNLVIAVIARDPVIRRVKQEQNNQSLSVFICANQWLIIKFQSSLPIFQHSLLSAVLGFDFDFVFAFDFSLLFSVPPCLRGEFIFGFSQQPKAPLQCPRQRLQRCQRRPISHHAIGIRVSRLCQCVLRIDNF